jgi:acyl dehydratase
MTATSAEFEKATDYQFREEDIERAKALVGRWSPSRMREHFTTVTHDVMRNFARGYGDDNPLFADEDYGTSTRWGAQIAPPMISIAVNRPLLGDPPDFPVKRPSFRGIHVFVSGSTWDWYRPLAAGDQLYSFGGTESVVEKKSEFAERSVLITGAGIKMNQRGEIVAISRTLAIHTERKTAREKGKYAGIEPATYTDDDMAKLDAVYAAEGPRGSETRWWEDVQVGDAVQPMAKGPLTETDMIVFHAGGYGFVPYEPCSNRVAYKNRQRIAPFYVKNEYGVPDVAQRVHWDSAWAQAIGNPMAYDYGVMRETWLTHYLTDWIGDDGWIVRQHDEVRKFNYIGDTQIISGEVVGKHLDDGVCSVDIEFRATNQRGTVTAPAEATVLLPSRVHGSVRLPLAPEPVRQKATDMFARHCELGGMAPWANLAARDT